MEPLKVAILGQGRSGRDIHGRYLSADSRFKIVAVVEPLHERRLRAATEFGCEAYSDIGELWSRDDIDLVVNATPSHLHVPVTMQLLDAGLNVICEKPLARDPSDVERLMQLAEARGVLFTVFQQSRFAPYFRQVKEVIASGVLGRIVQVSINFSGFARRWDWQCLQEYNGGNLLNTGPHPLDQALNLLDSYDTMPTVFCAMDRANTSGDAEDYVKLVLRAPDGPVVDLEISSCDAYPSATYVVQGTNGGLKSSMDHAEWRYFIPVEAPKPALVRTPLMDEQGMPRYCSETLTWHEGSWALPEAEKDLFTTMAGKYYAMIHDWFATGTPLEVTPRQVRQQIAVIAECHRQNPLSRLSS